MSRRSKRMAAVALVACAALFGIVFGFAFPQGALAWENCPKGLVNDPYPGSCRRYEDTNGDNICDLSQPKPSDPTTTTTSLAATTTTSREPPTGDCPLGPCIGCGACLSVSTVLAAASTSGANTSDQATTVAGAAVLAATDYSATTSTTAAPPSGSGNISAVVTPASDNTTGASLFTHYNVSPIAIGFFLVYAASFILHKTKRIRITTHRKIWNVLLLATFLITGILGMILTIQLDYTLPFSLPASLLFWHVETGVSMTLISLFHVGWHLNYYRNLLRSGRSKARAARATERTRTVADRQLVWEARERRRSERGPRPTALTPSRGLEPDT